MSDVYLTRDDKINPEMGGASLPMFKTTTTTDDAALDGDAASSSSSSTLPSAACETNGSSDRVDDGPTLAKQGFAVKKVGAEKQPTMVRRATTRTRDDDDDG